MNTDLINTLGAGSGMDTKAIVAALVEADVAPKQSAIDRKNKDVEAEISAMGKLKSAMQTLKEAFEQLDDQKDFNFVSLANSQPETIAASFDGTLAEPGSYDVQVSQLARQEVRQSEAYANPVVDLNNGAATTVTLQLGAETEHTINLAAGDASLASLAQAVNDLDIGVSARLVEVGAGSHRLLLEGGLGSANALVISDNLFGLGNTANRLQTAQDAQLTINGLQVSRPDNLVDDLVPGVKLALMGTTDQSVMVSVGRDTSAAAAAIKQTVTAYNSFEEVLGQLTAAGTTAGEVGELKNDAAVRRIRSQVRAILTEDSSTPGSQLSGPTDLGISVQRNGTFAVDDAKLGQALAQHYADVTRLFSADTDNQTQYGVAARGLAGDMIRQLDDYLGYDGLVAQREGQLTGRQGVLADDQAALDERKVVVEARYTRQFSTMNKIMDEMKSMQKYLEQQLDNLPFTADNS